MSILHILIFFKKLIYFLKKLLLSFFLWTVLGQNEFNEIKLKNGSKLNCLQKQNFNNSNINIIKKINSIGLKVITIINLRFAFGFHYHCLKISIRKLLTVNQFINKKIK